MRAEMSGPLLNLLPFLDQKELDVFWQKRIRAGAYKSAAQLLVGLFPRKMADCLLKIAKISPDRIAETLTDQERQALWRACTAFEVEISAGNGFDRAQVCSGGVDTEEVNPKTMESIRVPELYFAGEILDVDGACGGYNLQWAFTSGIFVADEILKQGIRGIAELIVNPSLINLDFADVRTILKDKGVAHLGVGVAKGDNRIIEAVRVAVNSPLLETTIEGARGVILNVVGGDDLTFSEVEDAAELVRSVVDASANIIFGARIDPNVRDEVEITVIATSFPGYDNKREDETLRDTKAAEYTTDRRITRPKATECRFPSPIM